MSEKTHGELLKEKLFIKTENVIDKINDADIVQSFSEKYKEFINNAKIETEAVEWTIKLAEAAGYTEFDHSLKHSPGDKIYYNNRGKALILSTIGIENINCGVKIIASHIDSPRLDLKPNPLYEDSEIAFLKTHYYGGIKKYQWTSIPVALHGVIMCKNKEKITVCIGENDSEPIFCITDLLPHLASEQMKNTLGKAITGEQLNVIVGTQPFKDNKVSERVKLNILSILFEKYNMTERDFASAELSIVPAFKARDVGFDKSLVGAYGHDDKVCAFPSIMAEIECHNPKNTTVTILANKEEIGSVGNTGLQSTFMGDFIKLLSENLGGNSTIVFRNSKCLSADVNAAFDPTFSDVYEKRNSCQINHGVVITKYTGSRGKGGASDADARFVREIVDLFDENDILWQIGELGKVDAGGGGTVAAFVANLNIDVVDVGVPVLSMHSPFELISKFDLYMTYKSFKAFLLST